MYNAMNAKNAMNAINSCIRYELIGQIIDCFRSSADDSRNDTYARWKALMVRATSRRYLCAEEKFHFLLSFYYVHFDLSRLVHNIDLVEKTMNPVRNFTELFNHDLSGES